MIFTKICSLPLGEHQKNNKSEYFTEAVIIEDHVVLQEMFEDVINMLTPGISIRSFNTGEEAFNYLDASSTVNKPTNKLILLDNDLLGEMSGVTLLEKLKSKLPANWVVLANSGDSEANEKMLGIGAQGTLDKQIRNLISWWKNDLE